MYFTSVVIDDHLYSQKQNELLTPLWNPNVIKLGSVAIGKYVEKNPYALSRNFRRKIELIYMPLNALAIPSIAGPRFSAHIWDGGFQLSMTWS